MLSGYKARRMLVSLSQKKKANRCEEDSCGPPARDTKGNTVFCTEAMSHEENSYSTKIVFCCVRHVKGSLLQGCTSEERAC